MSQRDPDKVGEVEHIDSPESMDHSEQEEHLEEEVAALEGNWRRNLHRLVEAGDELRRRFGVLEFYDFYQRCLLTSNEILVRDIETMVAEGEVPPWDELVLDASEDSFRGDDILFSEELSSEENFGQQKTNEMK